jgi:hypothetical protein
MADCEKGPLARGNDGCQAVTIPEPEDTFSVPSSQVVPDQVGLALDDERSMASAGLLLPATLAERLGSSRSLTRWWLLATGRVRPTQGASC